MKLLMGITPWRVALLMCWWGLSLASGSQESEPEIFSEERRNGKGVGDVRGQVEMCVLGRANHNLISWGAVAYATVCPTQ